MPKGNQMFVVIKLCAMSDIGYIYPPNGHALLGIMMIMGIQGHKLCGNSNHQKNIFHCVGFSSLCHDWLELAKQTILLVVAWGYGYQVWNGMIGVCMCV